MELRKRECDWCEKTYVVIDSTSSNRFAYCSEECEVEKQKAWEECDGWVHELSEAWHKYSDEYVPGDDEQNPLGPSPLVTRCPNTRREYLAFKERYLKWKNNHCWKESFWAWDESSGGSFFDGDGDVDVGGYAKAAFKLIGIAVVVWIGWSVVKGVWDGSFGGGGKVVSEAATMEKWQEHLEKRRESFKDGKPEREIEAKGLRNYTWEEWQAKFKKEHEAQEKKEGSGTTRAQEIGEQAVSAAKGLGDKAKSLWQNITSDTDDVQAIREAYDAHMAKMMEVTRTHGTDTANKMGLRNMSFETFKKEYRKKLSAQSSGQSQKVNDLEAELKRLNARLAELEGEGNTGEPQRTVAPKVEVPSPRPPAEEPVKPVAVPEKPLGRREAVAPARAPTPATATPGAPDDGIQSADGRRQNGAAQTATKDSKAIRIIVQGKGKTEEAALRYAFCSAVWKTVGTWVDSKTRIAENREKLTAIVATVTEDDISNYEVLDTWQQDGTTFVKARVSVSKKMIAPKLEKVFPDVFANE